MTKKSRSSLENVPGIGPRVAAQLRDIGVRSASCFKYRSPDSIYRKMCRAQGRKIDPCMLYVLRCAAYFVNHSRHDPELLKWWNWKDAALRGPGSKVNLF